MEREALVTVDLAARLRHPSLGQGEPISAHAPLPEEGALQILDCAAFLAEEGVYLLEPVREDFALLPVRQGQRFGIAGVGRAVYHPEQETRSVASERLARLLLAEGRGGYSPRLESELLALARGEEKTFHEVLAALGYEPTNGMSAQRQPKKGVPDVETLRKIYFLSVEFGLRAETFFLAYDLALRAKAPRAEVCLGVAGKICRDRAAAFTGTALEAEVELVEELKGMIYLENYFTLAPTAHHMKLIAESIAESLLEGSVTTDVVDDSYRNSETEFDTEDERRKDIIFSQIADLRL